MKLMRSKARLFFILLGLLAILPMIAGCGDDGDDGNAGPAGAVGEDGDALSIPYDDQIGLAQDLPGMNLTIVELTGASGAGGQFQVGDTITVRFTLTRDDGTTFPVDQLGSGRFWVSGPNNNMQRVLTTENFPGSVTIDDDDVYSYTFQSAIPATYEEPYSYDARFTTDVLEGQALLSGSYRLVGRAYANYYLESGDRVRDVDNVIQDFLLGTATALDEREVVLTSNCNSCHSQLQFHGGGYREAGVCITCHTAGAETRDSSDADPQTIEFKVMVHKIHNGAHLPSVNGVGVNNDGSRDYTVTPKGYEVAGHVYTELHHPVFPNANYEMPVDDGFDALTGDQQDQEETINQGLTNCAVCHDGASQGDQHFTVPSRRACGSCHDDVDWTLPYTSNGSTMLAQNSDSACASCHTNTDNTVDTEVAHVHPMEDEDLNPGTNAVLNSMTAINPTTGAATGNDEVNPGDGIQVDLSILEDDGTTDVDPADLYRMTVFISGPNDNRQTFSRMYFPLDALGAVASNYVFDLPQFVALEYLADATGAAQNLQASRYEFWTGGGDQTEVHVYEVTAVGAGTTLSADTIPGTNYLDVVSSAPFADDDFIVIDDAGNRDYYRVESIEGNRLSLDRIQTSNNGSDRAYLYTPWVRETHTAGATVELITLTEKTLTTDFTVTEATGQVDLVAGQFTGGNAVLVSYTGAWIMPDVYPHGYNHDAADDQDFGEWTGLDVEDGTYHVGIFPRRRFYVSPPRTFEAWSSGATDETQYYSSSVVADDGDFLVGSAEEIEEWDLVSSGSNCDDCHVNLHFHGRRGGDTCFTCHGTAGFGDSGEDNANFRTLLHKIHMGGDLANAATYAGGDFEGIAFPAWPGGVKHCDTCHGSSDAWQEPADRIHPDQTEATKAWAVTCLSCHDTNGALGHVELMTSAAGNESCTACHDPGSTYSVESVHKNR